MTEKDKALLLEARRIIDQRIDDMIARTIASAESFAASPAYARAIREIVDKGKAALKSD